VSEFVPKESAKVVIGVCGEQGSGKTVFLTCVFQSIGTAFPDDVIVDFDRKDVGNANYFQTIEDWLIGKGPAPGTTDRSLFPVRIFVRPYESRPGTGRPTLSVDLLDFAGRHFRSMADLKDLAEETDADPDDIKALREVNETLERADAFVILINSTEIDPLAEAPKRNPFSPSVNFMLAHCRAERKPVALLFSQIDQTPRLTEELFLSMERVQEFERKFTSDLQESLQGGRPYGIARRISCYETISGDLAPRKQTDDGSIWLKAPAQVVLDLLRAVMPRINERAAQAAEEALKAEREKAASLRLEEQEKEMAEQRRRRRKRALQIVAVFAVLLVLGLVVFTWLKRTESYQVRLLEGVESKLRNGKLTAIEPPIEVELRGILADQRAKPGGTAAPVQAAIENLQGALEQAGQRLAGEPSLEVVYRDKIARFQGLVPLFDPAVTDPWRRQLLPMLAARVDFLSDWLRTPRGDRRARTTFLDEGAKRFLGAGDRVFYSLLAAQSTKEKEAEVAGWQARIDADADVATRLSTIQRLLASAVAEKDPEFSRLVRKALAGQLAATILKRQENGFLRDKLLTPLAPDLAKLGDGEVRFEGLARDLLACSNQAECEKRQDIVQEAIKEAAAATAGWSLVVDNLLRNLLLDLPLSERPEVWKTLSEALANAYLFSSREDAWPSGLVPLAKTIQTAAEAENAPTEDLIERFARHPIYERELLYLQDHLAAAVASRQLVPIYSSLLTTLADKGSMLQTGSLNAVQQQVSSVVANRGDAAGPLAGVGREIEQVLSVSQSVNSQRSRGVGDPSAALRLERLLKDAKDSHCAAFKASEAFPECH
jgi:hypothetical protein